MYVEYRKAGGIVCRMLGRRGVCRMLGTAGVVEC